MDSAYFDIFKNLGQIKESVLNSNNSTCTDTKKEVVKAAPISMETSTKEVQTLLADDKPAKATVRSDEMIIGTYAVYFVAHKDINQTEKAIEKMKKVVGPDYSIKVEPARGLQSGVIYNLETISKAKEVKAKAVTIYPDSYIVKVK